MDFNFYGLLVGIGIWIGCEVSLRVVRERKINIDQIEKLFGWTIIGGIIGARIYHVLDWWDYYKINFIQILMIWRGGLGIWGAISGGILGSFLWWLRNKGKILFREVLDLIAIGLPIGQTIGRWGNYLNDEIVGKNGEPLFLYESLATFLLFLLIYFLRKKFRKRLMGIYLIGYGGIRLLLENLRQANDQWLIGSVSIASILALWAILLGSVFIFSKSISRIRMS